MTHILPFTFGIPLLPRACARDWPMVERLLGLALTSALAQTDQRFNVIVAGHERPQCLPEDARVSFLRADWPVEAVRPDNRDRGRKTDLINRHVLDHGGGLLMFLDADDWVDTRLVGTARSHIGPNDAAGVIQNGYAVDFRRLKAAPLPHPDIFDGSFHRICGSSVVLKLKPDDPDPVRRDPNRLLHEHYRVVETAADAGFGLARLPVLGCYLVNTSDSHSEVHGPYAEWRREFNEGVNRLGRRLDDAFTARFGLDLHRLRAPIHGHRFESRPAEAGWAPSC
ncbi:glycosyltransferase family A protein [Chelativorans sp. AA-79]|uniref:glycosyltransferase family A protein n=1 Tax=Chelativorans sp. AA-79 TaxID=3028735 RepID=UPI0023F98F0F|nr:glycosyltransferase family A protein [Chelativorans sp. AA-79]WEX10116.1 glycosyltransferase family A protein [Chelativorans sp. AA-79]